MVFFEWKQICRIFNIYIHQIVIGDSIIKRVKVWIQFQICVPVSIQYLDFCCHTMYAMVIFCGEGLDSELEVVGHFVDIGGIVDHHWFNLSFRTLCKQVTDLHTLILYKIFSYVP